VKQQDTISTFSLLITSEAQKAEQAGEPNPDRRSTVPLKLGIRLAMMKSTGAPTIVIGDP